MPGLPHAYQGKPIHERTKGEIVRVFVVFPLLFGAGILWATATNAWNHGREFQLSDWLFQVAIPGVIGFGVMGALPVVGLSELRARRRSGNAGEPTSECSLSNDAAGAASN